MPGLLGCNSGVGVLGGGAVNSGFGEGPNGPRIPVQEDNQYSRFFGGDLGGRGQSATGGSEPPQWLASLISHQESVRTVDLPALPELKESEIGPLVAGDWVVIGWRALVL